MLCATQMRSCWAPIRGHPPLRTCSFSSHCCPFKTCHISCHQRVWPPDCALASSGTARRSYCLLGMPPRTREQRPGLQQVGWAWEHGDMGNVTCPSSRDYCNRGAAAVASGLRNRNGVELADRGRRCQRLAGAQAVGEQGSESCKGKKLKIRALLGASKWWDGSTEHG